MKPRPPASQSPSRENLTAFNNTLAELTDKADTNALASGVLYTSSKEKPFGLILVAGRGYSGALKKIIKKIPRPDFYLPFPVRIKTILHKLSRLERDVNRLKKQVTVDEMTGMYNFRFFRKQLKREIARAGRTGLPCSLIMFDIDHFKHVNDTYGHQAGDTVLKEITRRITTAIRSIDYPIRYGGEEFAVILPETGLVEAIRIAERVRETVAEKPFRLNSHPPITVTISGGVAEFSNLSTTSMETFIEAADRELYQAKNGGRNRISFSKADFDKITKTGVDLDERALLLGKDNSP